jgi:MoxR-like ATPase
MNIPESFLEDSKKINRLTTEMSNVILGQDELNKSLVIGLLVNGHLLIEGLPGLAKTLAIKTLASLIDSKFQRVQFTPDLLPSDLIGTLIFNTKTSEFSVKKGPLFTNFLLADEINRAPAKVQSALLEAMAEKQVTIGEETFKLEEPFLVLATQNPIEQEGTYPLPEAQLDRFLFKTLVYYPPKEAELKILESKHDQISLSPVLNSKEVLMIRKQLDNVYIDPKIREYILRIVQSTRPVEMTSHEVQMSLWKDWHHYILLGASPRASIYLQKAAAANAFLEGRNYVLPDDIKAIARSVLRHRILLTYEAESEGRNVENILSAILETILIP